MNRFAGALAIRPGEGRLVGYVAATFALLEAGRGLGEVAIHALVLDAAGTSILPPLYIALGLAGLVLTLGFGAAVARSTSDRFFAASLAVIASVIVIEGVATAVIPSVGLLGVAWVSVFAAGLVLTTILWTVANTVFHARQAKRLFPLCTGAAIAGGFAGLLSAGPLAHVIGLPAMIVGHGALVGAGSVTLLRIRSQLHRTPHAGPAPSRSLRAGAGYVMRSPLMRLISLAYLLLAVLLFSMAFPFAGAIKAAFPDAADFAGATALIAAVVTALSFVLTTLVANRLFARLGVTTVALLLPIVYLAGFGIWIVSFTTLSAIGVKVAQEVTQRGLTNSAWSAMFTVVPAARRGQVLAFVDGVPGQLGTMLSGVMLLLATALGLQGGAGGSMPLFALGAVTALACLVVLLQIRRRYAASLVSTLREGLAEQVLEGGPGLAALARDPEVIADLRTALSSSRPGERRLAVELLGQLAPRGAERDLAPLAADDDPAIRQTAVEALERLGGDHALAAVTAATDDPDATVRAGAVRAAATIAGTDGAWLEPARMHRLTADAHPGVRAELAVAMCRMGRDHEGRTLAEQLVGSSAPAEQLAGLRVAARLGSKVPWALLERALVAPDADVRAAAVEAAGLLRTDPATTDRIVEALADDAPGVRAAAARTLAARGDVPRGVLDTLATGSEAAQDAALAALDGAAATVRGELVTWAVGQVDRAARLRRFAAQMDGAPPSLLQDEAIAATSAGFLAFLLRRRGAAIEARLLKAIALLDAPDVSGLIRRCLRSTDPETRAQAIEALDALGDSRLTRAVVRLLDSEPDVGTGDAASVSRVALALADDPDVWVRAMALRTLGAYLGAELRWVRDRALADPDATVRAAIEGVLPAGGSAVPDSRPTLHEIDRMLFLRGVPLFSMLAPEDLQRLAATAIERTYAGDEPLVRQGELGQELVVIVEGSVRVIRHDAGTERLIVRYGAGDHIGELAVLREGAARTATVVAEEPGVRGLVVGGEAVKAILRERPDAAMAMLATLAERLSNA